MSKYKVWLELPNENHQRNAFLATNMLHKLGYNKSVTIKHVNDKYYLTLNSAGEFLELADNGHWFDLEFINK